MRTRRFANRAEAGRLLADKLLAYAGRPDVLILALPRGGVPVAFEVAERLGAPLDIFLVRKLGVPFHQELAMGAIASGGVCLLNDDVVQSLRISRKTIDTVAQRERHELERREHDYRRGTTPPAIAGRTVILVDDGLATGASMRAAVAAVKLAHPARTVVAVPVAAVETADALEAEVDQLVCVERIEDFCAVGEWYDDFSQVTDAQVRLLLQRAAEFSISSRA